MACCNQKPTPLLSIPIAMRFNKHRWVSTLFGKMAGLLLTGGALLSFVLTASYAMAGVPIPIDGISGTPLAVNNGVSYYNIPSGSTVYGSQNLPAYTSGSNGVKPVYAVWTDSTTGVQQATLAYEKVPYDAIASYAMAHPTAYSYLAQKLAAPYQADPNGYTVGDIEIMGSCYVNQGMRAYQVNSVTTQTNIGLYGSHCNIASNMPYKYVSGNGVTISIGYGDITTPNLAYRPLSTAITDLTQNGSSTPCSPLISSSDVSGIMSKLGADSSTGYVDAVEGCSTVEASQPFVAPTLLEVLPNDSNNQVCWKSSVSMAVGAVNHEQQLFSAPGSIFPLDVVLYYKSTEDARANLGYGWSHNFDISVSYVVPTVAQIREGNERRTFTRTSTTGMSMSTTGSFVSQAGDGAVLQRLSSSTTPFQLTEKKGVKKLFNALGQIQSITDLNNNALTFTYPSTTKKLSKIEESGTGRAITIAYNSSGKISTVTDPAGHPYTVDYDGVYLKSIKHPDNGTWNYTYLNNLLASKIDPNGIESRYEYNSDKTARQTTVVQTGEIKSITYQPVDAFQMQNAIMSDATGASWTYTTNNLNSRVMKKAGPLGKTFDYEYFSDLKLKSVTESGIGKTSYTYDAPGNLKTLQQPGDASTTTFTYNSLGEVLTSSGPAGSATNTYDTKGNLLTDTDTHGVTTTYDYYADGRLKTIKDANNYVTTVTYDSHGFPATIMNPLLQTTTLTYDINGNLLTNTIPDGTTTTYEYDAQNRLKKVTDPLGNISQYEYDLMGNQTKFTDANVNVSTYTFNDLGQVTTSKDPMDKVTTYVYGTPGCPSCGSGVNRLIGLIDAKGQNSTWKYDLLGRVTQQADPLLKASNYTFDDVNRTVTKTNANILAITSAFDPKGRLTTKTYPDSTTLTFVYDDAGRVMSATNSSIAYTYTYNQGRVASVSDSRGFSLAYLYDAVGNRTRTTLQQGSPDERQINYTYDAVNRFSSITSAVGRFDYTYDSSGRRTALKYPSPTNDKITNYSYDSAGRLTGILHTAGASTITFANYSGFDKTGNRKNKITPAGTESYEYDNVYRLTKAITPKGTENYSYDGVGNRLSGPTPMDTADKTYLYDSANRMTRGRVFTYDYDNEGNQISKLLPNAADKTWTRTWNLDNKLAKEEKTKGAEKRTISYRYDPFGRRIGKTYVYTRDGTPATTKTTTWEYIYDGDDITLEIFTPPSGVPEKTYYTHGAGIDEHLALERGGSYYYYHQDGLNSVVAITDGGANVVQSYSYDSYGLPTPTHSFRNYFQYTGREFEAETGTLHYLYRERDLLDGAFVSKDPAGFAAGINLFAYVQGNPINFIDPFGLASLVTNMSDGTTTFDPRPEDPSGLPLTIQTRNGVDRRRLPGAQDPFSTPDVYVRHRAPSKSYGPNGAYIETGDSRHRNIHGGGSCPNNNRGDSQAPRQGWCVTMGCTRGQNEDVINLGVKIEDFQSNHPGVPIPYTRN